MKCRCGETDPEKFAGDRTSATGKQSTCKKCQAQRAKERRKKYAIRGATDVDVAVPASSDEFDIDVVDWTPASPEEQSRRVAAAKAFLKQVATPLEERFPKPLQTMFNMGQDEVLSDEQVLLEQSCKEWTSPGGEPRAPLKRILILPDIHAPFEDKRAWKLVMQVGRAWKPDIIVDLGDLADFYSVSSHSKSPGRVNILDEEVMAVNEILSDLDSLGASEKYFVEGNHENRLERFLMDKAKELFGLVKVQDLFKLKERGWHYTPYKESLKLGKITFTHDCGNAGAQAHTKASDTFQGNVGIGHTHRMSISYSGNAHGESHVGAMFGWLGDVTRIDYLHQIQALRAWQLGFGAGWMEENGVVHLAPIPIVNYRCVLEGKLYVG